MKETPAQFHCFLTNPLLNISIARVRKHLDNEIYGGCLPFRF
jgi:hypothetical protein